MQDSRIALVALLRYLPVPRLDLSLFVRKSGSEAPSDLRLAPDSSPQARAALQTSGSVLSLCPTAYETWWSFEQLSQFSIADILIANVLLEARAGDRRRFLRQMRRVVPLKLDEADRIYVEVPRVELGEKHIIVAHSSIFPDVLRTLATISLPGYRTFNAASLPGLPEGWGAASDVIIVRQFDGEADLAALSAVASVQLSVTEGMVLPYRSTWHSHCQPEIRAVVPDEDGCQVALIPAYSQTKSEIILGPARGAARIPLVGQDLVDGDYRVLLERSDDGHAPLAHAALGFAQPVPLLRLY